MAPSKIPPAYRPVLLRAMGYLDGVEYPKGTVIDRQSLIDLTPTKLMRWFNKMVYGSEDPEEDTKPLVRSTSVEFWKKAISCFMVNRITSWNEISIAGNPTRCTELNDLIRDLQ